MSKGRRSSFRILGKCLSAFLLAVIVIAAVSAEAYYAEYTQVADKLVVKETINGIEREAFVDSESLEKSSSGYYFVKKIVFDKSYSSAEIVLNLDEGIVLEDSKAYPAGYATESDGRTISIIWGLESVKQNQIFAMFAKLEDTKRNNLVWIWVMGIVILALILIFGYAIYKKLGKRKSLIASKVSRKAKGKRTEARYEHLLDTEKRVIEELKKADRHELWQKQLQLATGFSKAKVSRLVRNLEARGLIEKIPFGNTNKVRLK